MTRLSWPDVALGEIASVTAGQSAPQDPRYFGGRNRFVRVSHLDQRSHTVIGHDSLTDEAVIDLGLKLYRAGTIVLPKSGASVRLEKRAVLPFDAYLVSHLAAVEGDPDLVDQYYLFYALRSHRFSKGKADGYPTLKLSEIRTTKIPLPPPSEQRAIAHVLRTVQGAKEATEQVIAAARELKRSLLQDLIPGEEHGMSVRTRLGSVLRVKHGFGFEGEFFSSNGGDYIVVTPGNFNEDGAFRDKRQDEKYYRKEPPPEYVLKRGDLLLVMTEQKRGLIGAAGMVPEDDLYLHNQRLGLVTEIDGTRVTKQFLYYLLNSPKVRRQLDASATGTKVRHTSPRRIEDVTVYLPTLAEQDRIAEALRAVDDKVLTEEVRRDALATLFDSLLHNLMTARLRVADLKVPV